MSRTWLAVTLAFACAASPVFAADVDSATGADAVVAAEAPVIVDTVSPLTRAAFRTEQHRGALPVMYVGVAALQAYDACSTLSGIKSGAIEGNPAMRAIVSHPAVFIAVKGGLTAASISTAE